MKPKQVKAWAVICDGVICWMETTTDKATAKRRAVSHRVMCNKPAEAVQFEAIFITPPMKASESCR